MSALLRPGRLDTAPDAAAAVTMADLPLVEGYRYSNRLYSMVGLQVGSLIWQWQSQSPSRIEEWVTLSDSHASIHLAFDGDAIGLQAEPFEWRGYSGETRLLAWTAHHEPLLELLRTVFRRDWVPESIGDCDAPAARACMRAGFSVAREDGICIVTGLVDFDAARVDVPDPAPASAARTPASYWHHVQARLPIILDEVDLARTELAAIAHGCIVRLDNRTLATDRPRVAIRAGSAHLIADIHQLQATVVGFAAASSGLDQFTCGGIDMNDDHASGTAPGAVTPGVDAAAVPVRLTFSAGRLVRRFGELADVAPGYVYELDKRLDDQSIAISANEVPIALGELVCVGDLVGIRVTRMLTRL